MIKKILHSAIIALILIFSACSSKQVSVPDNILQPYIPENNIIEGDIIVLDFTSRFKEIVRKIQRNAKTNFSWYIGYIMSNKPDKPLPYNRNLGISLSEHFYILKWRNKKVLTKIGTIFFKVVEKENGVYIFSNDHSQFILTKISIDVNKKCVNFPDVSLDYLYRHTAVADNSIPEWKGLLWTNVKRETGLQVDDSFEMSFEKNDSNRQLVKFSIGKISGSEKCIINISRNRTHESQPREFNYYVIYSLKNIK